MIITFPTIEFASYVSKPGILNEANEIARTTRPTQGRTRDDVWEDALFGLAVQHAVLDTLNTMEGCVALPADPSDKSYDILLEAAGREIKIDVKAMRKHRPAKSFTVSGWEYENADDETLYLLFDCSSGEAEFDGFFWKPDLREGRYTDWMGRATGYIFWTDVNDPDGFFL